MLVFITRTFFDFKDMAAIPDFVSGAMENWGLVTFREARLLYDNQSTSTGNKEDIVKVIGHELAHMWFGMILLDLT
jgi:aminopeptidase N